MLPPPPAGRVRARFCSLPRLRGRVGVGAGSCREKRPHPGLPPQAGEGAGQGGGLMPASTPSPASGGRGFCPLPFAAGEGEGWGGVLLGMSARVAKGTPSQPPPFAAQKGEEQSAFPRKRGRRRATRRGKGKASPPSAVMPRRAWPSRRTSALLLPPPQAGEGWGGGKPVRVKRPHPGLPPQTGEGEEQRPPPQAGEGASAPSLSPQAKGRVGEGCFWACLPASPRAPPPSLPLLLRKNGEEQCASP